SPGSAGGSRLPWAGSVRARPAGKAGSRSGTLASRTSRPSGGAWSSPGGRACSPRLCIEPCVAVSSDPAPLRRPAAIVRDGGHVLDRAGRQPGRLQRPDGGLPARARTLDEDVDLAHAVFHRAARRGLGRHLRGVRRGLARSLEPDLTRGRPRDDVARRVGNRDDRVVERAPDVSVPVSNVLPLLAAHLLGGLLTAPWRHILLWLPCEVIDPRCWLTRRGLLLPGLLLAGHRLLLALAGARVGLRPLPAHGEPAAVADPLVAADLDLAPDVGLDLAA